MITALALIWAYSTIPNTQLGFGQILIGMIIGSGCSAAESAARRAVRR